MSEQHQLQPVKKPTTYMEQIELLKLRGLIINDPSAATEVLNRISYYRLSAYMLTLKSNKRFLKGTTFEDIYRLYEFDMKLRVLLMSIFEYVEISFRSQISYVVSNENKDAISYRNPLNFKKTYLHTQFLISLDKHIEESKNELFISHHTYKYGQYPAWVAFEVLSFGTLSKLYKNLATRHQKYIARKYYSLQDHSQIESWLHAISLLRNRCAHYSRVYNITLRTNLSLSNFEKNIGIKNNQVFTVIYILNKLITDKNTWTAFVISLSSLIEEYEDVVDIRSMGFIEQWSTYLTAR